MVPKDFSCTFSLPEERSRKLIQNFGILAHRHTGSMLKWLAMYVPYNIEALSYIDGCCGKAVSTIYSAFVFVALGIQHATRICRIVICGLPVSTIFFFLPFYLISGMI
jgi:hypothetical protein